MTNKPEANFADDADRLIAYHVKEIERGSEKKDFWTRIGVAFPHKDGKGFNVMLDLLPPDGKLVLRTYEPKDEQ